MKQCLFNLTIFSFLNKYERNKSKFLELSRDNPAVNQKLYIDHKKKLQDSTDGKVKFIE